MRVLGAGALLFLLVVGASAGDGAAQTCPKEEETTCEAVPESSAAMLQKEVRDRATALVVRELEEDPLQWFKTTSCYINFVMFANCPEEDQIPFMRKAHEGVQKAQAYYAEFAGTCFGAMLTTGLGCVPVVGTLQTFGTMKIKHQTCADGHGSECIKLTDGQISCDHICQENTDAIRNTAIEAVGTVNAPAACMSTAYFSGASVAKACGTKPIHGMGSATCIEHLGLCPKMLARNWYSYVYNPTSKDNYRNFLKRMVKEGFCNADTGRCGTDWSEVPEEWRSYFKETSTGPWVCELTAKVRGFTKWIGNEVVAGRRKNPYVKKDPCVHKIKEIAQHCYNPELIGGVMGVCKGNCYTRANGTRTPLMNPECEFEKLFTDKKPPYNLAPAPAPAPASCIDPNKQKVQTPDGPKLLKDIVDHLPGPKLLVVPFPESLVQKLVTGIRQFLGMSFGLTEESKSLLTLNDEVAGRAWDGAGGWEISTASGDKLYLAQSHELLVRKAEGPKLVEARHLNVGDAIVTTGSDTTISEVKTYTLQRKVTLMMEPMGFLLSEKGVLIPPMDETLPGEDKFVNLDDVMALTHAWAPVTEELYKDHPCLFKHLETNPTELGHATIVQLFEDFLKKHPHETNGAISEPGSFLRHIRAHREEFSADAMKLCSGDASLI